MYGECVGFASSSKTWKGTHLGVKGTRMVVQQKPARCQSLNCEVVFASMHAKSFQSCPTLWDWIPPGSSVHRILQARILERFTIFSSRGSSWPRNPNQFIRTPQYCCTGGWRDSYVRDVSGQTVLTLCLVQLGLHPWRKELACPAPPFSFLFLNIYLAELSLCCSM